MASTSRPTIEHVIVVMLENRSYDNVLGWLYHTGNDPPYDKAPARQTDLNGLKGDEENPPVPPLTAPIKVGNRPTTTDGKHPYPGTTIPVHDPGEPFGDMAQQILGAQSRPKRNPYSGGPWPPDRPMQGFTLNYATILKSRKKISAHLGDIMNYFTPPQVPVTAWLANHFAVCDQWFASIPTQTFANRAFAHCAAPGVHADGSFSLIDDLQYLTDPLGFQPSIFSVLDEFRPKKRPPIRWKVYFHDYSISTMVDPYLRSKATSDNNVNFATYDRSDWGKEAPDIWPVLPIRLGNASNMTTFMHDLHKGELPNYSFIEPRYARKKASGSDPPVYNRPNSNHPGSAELVDIWSNEIPIDVADGEAFLRDLYNALCCSKHWDTSLLIITYDEHGGLYDHVLPPLVPDEAVPLRTGFPPARFLFDSAAHGFNYNVYGCRVPTIIVSPFIPAGTTIIPPGTVPFDHASIPRTIRDCFGVPGASLSRRDAVAPSLYPFLSATPGNNPGPCPAAAPCGAARL